MRPVRVAALAVAAAALVAVPAAAAADVDRTITVTGTGSVEAVADRAELSVGVQVTGATARAAVRDASARTRRVVAALEALRIPRRAIEVQGISVFPGEGGGIEPAAGGGGATATSSILVTLRDPSRVDRVIDVALAAGDNQFFGPTLTRSDRDALYQEALAAAAEAAAAKAAALAARMGVTLGAVQAVYETGPISFGEEASAGQGPFGQTRRIRIEAVVSVRYAIS